MSSLIIVPGRKKITNDQRKDFGTNAGVGFIKLVLNDPYSSDVPISGFQSVSVSIAKRAGRRQAITILSKNAYNQDCSNGHLVFYPNELEQCVGFLPDTPYNRKKLAVAKIAANAPWHIADDDIDREIDSLADTVRNSEEFKTAMANIKAARDKNIKENEAYEKRNESQSDRQSRDKFETLNATLDKLIQLQTLQANTALSEMNKQHTTQPTNAVQEPIRLSDAEMTQIKEEVYREKKIIIDKIKAEKGKSWQLTKEYKDYIKPEIEKKKTERLNNANNTGVGNNN